MNKEYSKYLSYKDGASAALPIVIGYIPIAMAFGILSKATGISMVESFLFSALIFAGASQFMALNLLSIGAGCGEIILTTLLVNFRHFLLGSSLAIRLPQGGKKLRPLIAFGLTDETFSVACFTKEKITKEFILSLEFISYLAWVIGTVSGYLLGEILPEILKNSMGIALYAMFISILIPEIKKSKSVGFLVCLSAAVNTFLNYFKILSQGWSLIASIVLVSALGAYIFDDEVVADE